MNRRYTSIFLIRPLSVMMWLAVIANVSASDCFEKGKCTGTYDFIKPRITEDTTQTACTTNPVPPEPARPPAVNPTSACINDEPGEKPSTNGNGSYPGEGTCGIIYTKGFTWVKFGRPTIFKCDITDEKGNVVKGEYSVQKWRLVEDVRAKRTNEACGGVHLGETGCGDDI